ncbi:transposase, partial [Clostridium sp.]|uniref:transposase n=1 Tax=Clostridium sp. TaxID=1506 RepID=UPI0035A0F7C9
MPYEQSLSYSRDLIKGTKIEVPKKKLILPFTGTATVKLYDSLTGKQTYEGKSENRISAVFGNMAYLDGFYYPILDNMQENILGDIYTTYPFRVIASKHDGPIGEKLIDTNSILVEDRAYGNHKRFDMFKEIGQSFVIRIKNNIVLSQSKKLKSFREENSSVVRDITCCLGT